MDEEDFDMLSDSEDEYSEKQKTLLEKVRKGQETEIFSSDEEVLGFGNDGESSNDEDEEDEEQNGPDSMESDIEGLDDDYGLPSDKAWGKKNKNYYSTDYVDQDYSTISEKDQLLAEMEEQEARKIQKRLAEQLDDADFGLDMIETKDEQYFNEEEVVKTDLSKLSKRQKQQLFEKENPEFLALVADFKDRLAEIKNIFQPFLSLLDERKISDCAAFTFIKTKYHLVLNYCINLSFYLMLKAKRLPINSHPVIKRLAQYRQLLGQMEIGQGKLLDEIKTILEADKNGQILYIIPDSSSTVKHKKKHVEKTTDFTKKDKKFHSTVISDDVTDEQTEESENEMNGIEEANIEDSIEAEKRAITYEMAKNKGLTPYRKKELRNPRVKLRNKYRKAKIRRKGAVREVRKEVTRYSGEISGIKASVKKSIKLK